MIYQCPLCQLPLHQKDQSLLCENRHQFDRAKEGYINLLPVQHKRSKNPGDSKEMMQARRTFLNAGHYAPMRDKVTELLTRNLPTESLNILDVGCGEGYYTHQFSDAVESWFVYGLDISKTAIRYAAKRYANCEFSVASSQRLPFSDSSVQAIVRIYAPCDGNELNRVLADNGIVVTVTPGPRHLYQLKAGIYDEVRLHDIPPEDLPGFELESEHSLHYPMTLSSQDASTLLQMTPFAWRAPEALWKTLAKCESFNCDADFTLRIYRKTASSLIDDTQMD